MSGQGDQNICKVFDSYRSKSGAIHSPPIISSFANTGVPCLRNPFTLSTLHYPHRQTQRHNAWNDLERKEASSSGRRNLHYRTVDNELLPCLPSSIYKLKPMLPRCHPCSWAEGPWSSPPKNRSSTIENEGLSPLFRCSIEFA